MRKRSVLLASVSLALLIGLMGTAVVWSRSDAEKNPPHAVARALTEEELAAGEELEVHYFDSFEEATEFIGADSADFQPPAAGNADEQDKHCVVQIEPLQPGQTASKVSELTCFDNFSDAIFAATGGAVRLPPSIEPGEVTEDMLEPPGPRSSTVIGIDYSGSSFSGSTLTWTTSDPNGCSDGTIYMQPSMPSGWANVVSSARSYQGCARYYHYDYTNYGGSALDCGYSCSTMGAMDNQTESEKWCQSCSP
jgi:hypothetical protein